MKATRTVTTALRALRRNPMRAMLTTLGIIIGISAVIAMMEIGNGIQKLIEKSMSSMGANTLMIHPGTASSGGISFGSGSIMTMTPQDCEAIIRECPAVRCAAPDIRVRSQIVYGNRNWVPFTIYGTTADYLLVRDWPMEEGDIFSERDVRNSNRVCVLGKTIVRELFQGESPLGKDIRIQNVSFRVVGVLSSKGANMMGMDQDDMVLAPWSTVKYRISGSSSSAASKAGAVSSSGTSTASSMGQLYPSTGTALYPPASSNSLVTARFANIDEIMASAKSPADIKPAIEQITTLLRARHKIREGEADDFSVRDMTEMITTFTKTTTLITTLLLVVAMISLAVGGIGIMNIMLVSVTERTREIGLRMAVGARPRDILRQFLVEAVVLCLTGGIIGILLGHGSAVLVRLVMHWPIATSPGAITAAVLVSATIGISFGYYPAWKASRLDPIDALRYE
jgi:ABC-type antimicrobial peptide transport system permease subunit